MSNTLSRLGKAVVAILISSLCSLVSGASDVRSTLFQEVETVFQTAQKIKAHVLAPASYSRALKDYRSAEKRYSAGGDLGKIEDLLQQSLQHLEQALAAAKVAELKLATGIDARNDALEVQANVNAKKLWEDAEKYLSKAAITLEEGNARRIPTLIRKAEQAYREAELVSIKATFLNGARDLLKLADSKKVERYAPLTLQRAQALLAEAEKSLEEDRYDRDKPRNLAREAKYTAAHALYIAERLRAIDDDDLSQEQLYLEMEAPVAEIANAANLVPDFSEGSRLTTDSIVDYIDSANRSIRELDRSLLRISQLEEELGGASEESQLLKSQLAQEADIAARFNQVNKLFAHHEADVFRQGNNVILRLVGLNFTVGNSVIETKNFELLGKVQKAIALFPDSTAIVEGHTDAYGSDELNVILSQDRAKAVREYLIVNMGLLSSHVDAIGYGETRPVANNETPEGRLKNRRIDLVIQPHF